MDKINQLLDSIFGEMEEVEVGEIIYPEVLDDVESEFSSCQRDESPEHSLKL